LIGSQNFEIGSRTPGHAHLWANLWSGVKNCPRPMCVPNLKGVAFPFAKYWHISLRCTNWPRDLNFWPFDLDVGVGVACDLGYPCAKFRLPRPFGFRVRADVRDIRQTDGRTTDADDRLMPLPPLRGRGIIMRKNVPEHTISRQKSTKLWRVVCGLLTLRLACTPLF